MHEDVQIKYLHRACKPSQRLLARLLSEHHRHTIPAIAPLPTAMYFFLRQILAHALPGRSRH